MPCFKMTGEKEKAFCCLPLGVGALIISFLMVTLMLGSCLNQISSAEDDHNQLDAVDYINLVFQCLPCICAILIFPGVLCKSAKLLQFGVYSIYPAMASIVISIIIIWIAAFTRKHVNGDQDIDIDGFNVGVKNPRQLAFITAALTTLWHLLQLIVLCYVGDILKSAKNQVSKGKSLWKIHQ